MKRKWKRSLSAIVAAMLLLSTAACSSGSGGTSSGSTAASGGESGADTSQSGENTEPQENTLPISDGSLTLKIYCPIDDNARQHMTDLSQHSVVKEIMEQTGINLEFIHPPAGDDGTYFNTTIASGEYPDLFYCSNFNNYPGGPEGAMSDKILMNIDDLIYQYAPNFLAMVDNEREAVAEMGGNIDTWIRGDGGAITKFGTMFLPEFVNGRIHNGFVVRKDLLEKYNLESPVTIEDYTNVMQVFKDNGIEVPLALCTFSETQFTNVNPIASAFDVSINEFQLDENGKVEYSRTMDEYKDFLTCMNEWAEAGFIDRDFISRSMADTNKLFYNGRAAITIFHNASTKQALSVGQLEDPNYDVAGLVYPRVNEEDDLHLSRQALSVNSFAWYVSYTCKNPVEAVRFVDYLHMEDTQLLTAWGLGNDEYPTFTEDSEGNRVFTDFMQNNPDMDYTTARAVYTCGTFQVKYDDSMERQQYNLPQNLQVWEAWATKNDNKQQIPSVVTMTVDESKEFTEIKTRMDNYADEMVYKFIFGEESLDKFDEFVAQLNELGAERAIEIKQAAYDRYLAR